MTAVIAINLLDEALVIADTRVSWDDHQHKDCLKKLYGIIGSRSRAVFGFAGDVVQAQTLIGRLTSEKLRAYNRPVVIPHLKDDLYSWLSKIVPPPASPEQRPNIHFLLAGLDPGRPQPKIRNGHPAGHMPFPTISFYEYLWGSETGRLLVLPRTGIVATIGSITPSNRLHINAKVEEFLPFAFGSPRFYDARARLIAEVIDIAFVKAERVGGPFQVLRVAPDTIHQQFIWPSSLYALYDIETQNDGDITTIINHTLNEQRKLYAIWDFPFRTPPHRQSYTQPPELRSPGRR